MVHSILSSFSFPIKLEVNKEEFRFVAAKLKQVRTLPDKPKSILQSFVILICMMLFFIINEE